MRRRTFLATLTALIASPLALLTPARKLLAPTPELIAAIDHVEAPIHSWTTWTTNTATNDSGITAIWDNTPWIPEKTA